VQVPYQAHATLATCLRVRSRAAGIHITRNKVLARCSHIININAISAQASPSELQKRMITCIAYCMRHSLDIYVICTLMEAI
jgi:hypothetical protein